MGSFAGGGGVGSSAGGGAGSSAGGGVGSLGGGGVGSLAGGGVGSFGGGGVGSFGGGGVGSLGGGGVGSLGGGGVGSLGGGGVGSFGGGVGSLGGGGVGCRGSALFEMTTVSSALASTGVGAGSGSFGILTVTFSSGRDSTFFGRSSLIISVMDFLGPGSVTFTGWTGGGVAGFLSIFNDSFLGGTTTVSVATDAAFVDPLLARGVGGFSLASARSTHLDSCKLLM